MYNYTSIILFCEWLEKEVKLEDGLRESDLNSCLFYVGKASLLFQLFYYTDLKEAIYYLENKSHVSH